MNIPSVQEAAAKFATSTVASLNSAAAQMAGVDVMYFRAKPDKRSQDVIFQSYTLYGVEDCPLEFKALYSEAGYDDGAITYNIMGLNFAVPMTMDIAVKTWTDVTGDDGSIPQEHDIVFIPMTRKLMEVASMTPVKQLLGQLTSYKVNLTIYKPTRSRLVGENLRDSIIQTTTNLDERFGDDIEKTLKDIVDPDQTSIHSSDSQDEQKTLVPEVSEENGTLEIKSIISEDIVIDGHTVARNYYNMSLSGGVIAIYKRSDSFTKTDERCLSFWVRLHGNNGSVIKNIKDASLLKEGNDYYLITTTGKNFRKDDRVVIKRGVITIPGKVVANRRIQINTEVAKKLDRMNREWYKMPGFSMSKDNCVTVISGGGFEISVKGGDSISIRYNDSEKVIPLSAPLDEMKWYGIIVNVGEKFSVDTYGTDEGLKKIDHFEDIPNNVYDEVTIDRFTLRSAPADITNIRFYSVSNTDTDKQITDLLSYNAKNDGLAIINDDANTFINKPYIGRQH